MISVGVTGTLNERIPSWSDKYVLNMYISQKDKSVERKEMFENWFFALCWFSVIVIKIVSFPKILLIVIFEMNFRMNMDFEKIKLF